MRCGAVTRAVFRYALRCGYQNRVPIYGSRWMAQVRKVGNSEIQKSGNSEIPKSGNSETAFQCSKSVCSVRSAW